MKEVSIKAIKKDRACGPAISFLTPLLKQGLTTTLVETWLQKPEYIDWGIERGYQVATPEVVQELVRRMQATVSESVVIKDGESDEVETDKVNDNGGNYARLASSGNYARLASSGYYAQLASSGDSAQLASSGYYARLASSGDSAQLASSGYSAQLASSGNYARLASSGYYARLASSGYYARLASSGDSAQLASSGDSAQLASSGYYAQLASSGDSAQLASSGDSAQLASSGDKSAIVSAGKSPRAMAAGDLSLIALMYRDENDVPRIASGVVGEDIEKGVWYEVVDGKLTPCADQSTNTYFTNALELDK